MSWLGVGAAYLTLLGVGLYLGHWLASRFGGRGGRGGPERFVPRSPTGPSHARDWLPLGTDFDRAFLPGAFGHDLATEPV